jgi:endonuclease/exonuclease/phosphatase family metal-dependent hydrolase
MKIVSWNIAGGYQLTSKVKDAIGYEKENLNYFIKRISEINPEIICLQEAHISKDKKINQSQIVAKALGCPFFTTYPYKGGESHIKPNYFLSLGTISQFPINSNHYYNPPNPKLSIKRENGKMWRTLDMGALVSQTDLYGKRIQIVNIHLLALHYFKRDWREKQFQNIRDFISNLLIKLSEKPTLVIGDFNYAHLDEIYPKMFTQGKYKEAFVEDTTPDKGQQDHILFSRHWSLKRAKVIKNVEADHYICLAKLELNHCRSS